VKIRNARYDGAVMLTHRDGAPHVQPSSECPACIALRDELAALLEDQRSIDHGSSVQGVLW
jgi:hypothetical protein